MHCLLHQQKKKIENDPELWELKMFSVQVNNRHRSAEGLTLEMSALKLFTEAN